MTGGTGTLGKKIQELISCYAPAREELDITDIKSCENFFKKNKPDVIIHAAAYTDVSGAESNKKACWEVNVTGTENIIRAADGKRFFFISTDYVFDGEKGNYAEDDIPNPTHFYALTKLAGELIIRQYPRTLIIRTAFKPDGPWRYPTAFTDQFTSHEFVSIIAPDIISAVLMEDLEGVVHIAGERKSIYELAKRVSPEVGAMSLGDVKTKLPRDTSLNCSKWKTILSQSSPAKK